MNENLLTVKELAEILRVNPMTVYRMAQNGTIPALKINSNWRFLETSIKEWLANKENTNQNL
jgi:excisionase family DNA binding protein